MRCRTHGAIRRLTDSEEFAILCRKPHCLTLEQYLQLDDWQIVNVYFRPPTPEAAKRGYYWPQPPRLLDENLAGTRFAYFRLGRQNGLEEAAIRKGWRRYKMVLLYALEGQRVPYAQAVGQALLQRGDAAPAVKDRVEALEEERLEARRRRKPEGSFG